MQMALPLLRGSTPAKGKEGGVNIKNYLPL